MKKNKIYKVKLCLRYMNFKGKSSKIIAGMITVAVLALLIFAGPANAFLVSLTGFAVSNPEKGDTISTTASVQINSNERMIMPNPLGVFIDGTAVCVFSVNAQAGDCDGSNGIKVELISSTSSFGYGYGYAYGYGYNYGYNNGYGTGTFTYNITLNTSNFTIGDHKIQLKVNAGDNHIYSSSEQSITIKATGAETTETNDNVAPNITESFDNNNVSVNLGGSTTGKVTVATFTSQPSETSSFSLPGLGKYLQIETDSAVSSDMNNTEIRVYYTDAEVSAAGLDEVSLRLYYYNSTSGLWQVYDTPNGGVNTTGNYVWAITNHFSIWGIFGSKPATPTTTIYYGGGGCAYDSNYDWGCSGWSSCVNGQQTRTCKTSNNCGSTYGKPAITQACTVPAGTTPTTPTTPTATTPGGLAGITGAVIGALGTGGTILVVIVILALIGTAVTLSVRRFRKK